MYVGLTLSYWDLCIKSLGEEEFGPKELQQTAEHFAKALEMAEKHLAREPDDPDSESVQTWVLSWDDDSDGLDGIAPVGAPLLQKVQALRVAVSDERQMAALLYCLRGVQAFYAAQREEQQTTRQRQLEERAIPAFQEALRRKPGYTGAQEKLDQVVQMVGKAGAMQHYNQANAYGRQQRWDDSIREFEAALKINPDFVEARDNLAIAHANRSQVYEQQGLLELALQDARLAVQMGFGRASQDVTRLEAKMTSSRQPSAPKKGGCFIATAAYGSPLAPSVATLCRFRDARLAQNRPGRWFIRLYERYSPPLAAAIAPHPAVRLWVRRILLAPAVWLARRWTR
jgi:tetratricopeptide (TPR) repeat protein